MQAMMSRTPLAAYSFASHQGPNFTVCYMDKEGNIGQSCYNAAQGWFPGKNGVVGRADIHGGIAITGWDEGREERVYYITAHGKLVERYHSPGRDGWYDGVLTNKYTASRYSQVAAISFVAGGTLCIRVYFQDNAQKIREVCHNGSDEWFEGHTFEAATPGSSISVSHIPGKEWYLWLFFQRQDTVIIEYLLQGSGKWKEGIFWSHMGYNHGACISCASYGQDNHRVFTIDHKDRLCVTEFNAGSNKWVQTKQLTCTIPASACAAVPMPGKAPAIRVYLQNKPGEIVEWGADTGDLYRACKGKLPTA